jgi:hypothetical protein
MQAIIISDLTDDERQIGLPIHLSGTALALVTHQPS